MSIFRFASQEELEALPHEQPTLAFLEFVRIAQEKLKEMIAGAEHNGIDVDEWRYDFQMAVIAVATRFGISEIADIEISTPTNYAYHEFRKFEVDLNRVVASMAIEGARRPRWGTVFLPKKAKNAIVLKLNALRKTVRDDASIQPHLKEKLLAQLDRFETSLERHRFELAQVGFLVLTLATIPGGIRDTIEVVQDVADIVTQAVADEEERGEAVQQQLEHIQTPKLILPSTVAARSTAVTFSGPHPAFSSGLADDDVPF